MIDEGIVFEGADLAIVSAFDALEPENKNGDYWNNAETVEVRAHIKAYYIAKQGTRCCYCNRHLGTTNHRAWDVEYVASRSVYPQFLFLPKNLAAACPDCNLKKGDKPSFVNEKRKTYPEGSDGFKIIHPHFDEFHDHILRKGLLYQAKTDKGKETIYTCDLLRFAVKYISWPNSAATDKFEKEVDLIVEEGAAAEAALEEIAAAILPSGGE